MKYQIRFIQRPLHRTGALTVAIVLSFSACDAHGLIGRDPIGGYGGASEPGTAERRSHTRVDVKDLSGAWTATFTPGARTVLVAGPERILHEPAAAAAVRTNVWVRLLPEPFDGRVDRGWLESALLDRSADVLEIAMQYVEGRSNLSNADGLRVAGDADYGPLLDDGSREEGSDFNDYLQVDWRYGGETDQAEARQANSLDCSGFVRMIFGYRLGLPLSLNPDGRSLPRRAVMMEAASPSVRVIENTGGRVTDFSSLQAGDLLFFDVSNDDGSDIDHVGIYLGVDEAGDHRFLSSRKTMNGPTLGDRGGRSVINGNGLYARGFRAALRL